MECTTVRNGSVCMFMTNKGCSYKSGVCCEIVEQCRGCGRSSELPSGWYCEAYPEPSIKWKNGSCNLATHISVGETKTKTKINPLKASKRARS